MYPFLAEVCARGLPVREAHVSGQPGGAGGSLAGLVTVTVPKLIRRYTFVYSAVEPLPRAV